MKRLLPCLMVVVFLGGCAMFGTASDNPKLVSALDAAKSAVQTAADVGAARTHNDDYSVVQQRFDELQTKKENSPDMTLIEDFRKVERAAYKTAVDSLQQQLNQKETEFSELRDQVKSLRSKLEDRVGTLEDRVQSLESQNRDLKQQKNELQQDKNDLRNDKQTLQDEKSQLQDQVAKLEDQANELETQKSALQEELDRVRKNNQTLESKVTSRADTIASLRSELQNQGTSCEECQTKLEQRNQTISQLRAELDSRKEEVRNLKEENRQIEGELDQELQEGDVRREDRRVYIALESKLLFGLGSVHVQDDIKSELQSIAGVLKRYPDREIRVEGHTDDLPLKNQLKERFGSNWELSSQRAINVLKYFVYGENINAERIAAVAYGRFRPRVPNNSTENRAKNRRVEVVLLPPELPTETRDLTN